MRYFILTNKTTGESIEIGGVVALAAVLKIKPEEVPQARMLKVTYDAADAVVTEITKES